MMLHNEEGYVTVLAYLSFGDGVHDGDGAERSEMVTAGVVVHLRQSAAG